MCGRGTWSVTLREELWLRLFENRVLRKIFRPKGERVQACLGKLHKERPKNLYFLQKVIRMMKERRMRQTWHVTRMGEMRDV
jgi:hypothetical protein